MKIRIDGTPEEIEQAAHIFGPSCGPIKLTKKRENAQLRDDLALSRRLEGFHWPWTRDRIKAQHLLPKSTV